MFNYYEIYQHLLNGLAHKSAKTFIFRRLTFPLMLKWGLQFGENICLRM